jgi:hypothetical protein
VIWSRRSEETGDCDVIRTPLKERAVGAQEDCQRVVSAWKETGLCDLKRRECHGANLQRLGIACLRLTRVFAGGVNVAVIGSKRHGARSM